VQKTAEPIEIWFGWLCGLRLAQGSMWVYIGALANTIEVCTVRTCAAAMRPYVKLLWPYKWL